MGRKKKEREEGRAIDIYGDLAREGQRYLMLPTGLYCNDGLRRAKQGDRLRLHDGWRTEEHRLGAMLTVRTDSETFDFFFRSIHSGWNVTLKEKQAKWEWQMRLMGFGAPRRDEVVIVFVKD